MSEFPTFTIEGVTLPRVICGTNALFGWSHVSAGRDAWIRRYYTPERVACVFAACMELGATAVMGPLYPPLVEALEMGKVAAQIDIVRPGTFEALVNKLEDVRDDYGDGYYHIIHLDVHGVLLTHDQYLIKPG